MQNNSMDWRQRDGEREEQARINVVIVYDTAEMGRRAMQVLGSAIDGAREAGPAVDLRLWRLNLLADSESGEMANADVENADMVFLAIEGADSLPSAMDSWLQVLTSKEEGMRGLALMIGNDDPRTDGPTLRELRSRLEAKRIDFLTNIPDLNPALRTGIPSPGDNFAARRSPPIFDAFEHLECSRGWGIND